MWMLVMELNAFITSRNQKRKEKNALILPTQTQIIETNPFESSTLPLCATENISRE
jgi:hypothetical protein